MEQGTPGKSLCQELGVSEQTFYTWRKRFAGMTTEEIKRIRELEDENRRLKALVSDLTLDKQMLQDVLSKKT